MNRREFAGVALALAMSLPGYAVADDAADEAAIGAIWNTYETARVAGDAESWLALWDENGVQMPPGIPARGKDVLVQGVPKAFAASQVTAMKIAPVETVIMGDYAFSRGNYTQTAMVKGSPVELEGKFMTIFRRQDDGSWRIYRDIFNPNR